jgi:diaminohydroxyphosphoribosylaminopyrimidine deaminase/5-amino-6-(5-phosphoribosylamino)uracil reductase
VHRLRARVDAIVTGIGTVAADDPLLTARNVRVRRNARRIVIDTDLDIATSSRLVATARQHPTTIVCAGELLGAAITARKCGELREAGVELIGASHCADGRRLDLREIMRELVTRYVTTNVMVECGPGLMGSFLAADLIDEARVYVAPMMLGDEMAHAVATGRIAESLTAARRFALASVEAVDGDVELIYRRSPGWLTDVMPQTRAQAAQRL